MTATEIRIRKLFISIENIPWKEIVAIINHRQAEVLALFNKYETKIEKLEKQVNYFRALKNTTYGLGKERRQV